MTKTRTVRITMDVDVVSLPREDWEDELSYLADDEECAGGADVSDDWPLEELSTDELAMCVEQATYDPEIFAGSMLYLKVAETRIVSHEFVEPSPLVVLQYSGGEK